MNSGTRIFAAVVISCVLQSALLWADQRPRIAVRYYGDVSCAHCDTFVSSQVPDLESSYPVEIDVTALDIMRLQNRRECEQRLAEHGQDYRIFPVLFIGNNAYQGNSAIETHLPREIEHLLRTGEPRPRLAAEQTTAGSPVAGGARHGEDAGPALRYFWAEGCPACIRAAPFLDLLEQRFPELRIERYEVSGSRENRELYRSVAEQWGSASGSVPAFFLPGRYWIGFSETNAREIASAVRHGLAAGWEAGDETGPDPAREYVDLPLFGRLSLADAPAFAVTGAIAAVDGFNPCSLWVLTFLVGLIVRTGSRRRTLAVGLVFLIVTASVYGLFILGLVTFFAAAGGIVAVRIVVAALAVTMGVINMKDYFAFKVGLSLTIPERFQPMIARMGRSVFDSSSAPVALVAATALFALGISVVELPCTAGFPVIWSQYVASLRTGTATFVALFSLYLLVYLAAEILVVVLSVVFMQRLSFSERHARLLKLVGGAIMVSIGVAYLGFPEATRTIDGVAWIFGAAILFSGAAVALTHATA